MENNLQIINKQEVLGKNFTVYGTFDSPLFLAKDVAEWIEHSNLTEMVKTIDEEEKLIIVPPKQLLVGADFQANTRYTFLTEEGVYEVLMQSRKPIAKQFKRKVKEILLTIRKHGAYMTPQTLENVISDPDFGIKLLTSLKEERQMRIEAEAKAYQQEELIEHKNEEIQKLLPDAQYARDTLKSISTLTTTQLAKELGMSAVTLNRKLRDLGIQHKVNEQWVLYAKYEDKGYTKTHTYTEIINGESRTWHSTVWTEAGRMFIHELIKKGLPCKQTSTLNNN